MTSSMILWVAVGIASIWMITRKSMNPVAIGYHGGYIQIAISPDTVRATNDTDVPWSTTFGTIAPYGNLTVPLSESSGLDLDAHLRNLLSLYEIVETSILPGSGSYEEEEVLRHFENIVASRMA